MAEVRIKVFDFLSTFLLYLTQQQTDTAVCKVISKKFQNTKYVKNSTNGKTLGRSIYQKEKNSKNWYRFYGILK